MAKKQTVRKIKLIKKGGNLVKKVGRFIAGLKGKLTKKRLLIVGGIVLVFLIGRGIFIRQKPAPVSLYEIKKGDFIDSLSASGKVKAVKEADLAFQTPGKVAWIGVKQGDFVRRGQYLAQLDATALNSVYMQSLANLRTTQATVENVHDQVKGHAGDETFAQKNTRTTAEAANDSAYEAMKIAKFNLDNAILVAPFDGYITSVSEGLTAGSNISIGLPAITVADPKSLFFESEVNETEVTKLKEGQKATLSIDAFPGQEFESTVKSIAFASNITSTGGTAYKINIALPLLTDIVVRMGMKGDAKFILGVTPNTIKIPSQSLVEDVDGNNIVWIIDNSGKARKRQVNVGITSIDETQILSGLSEGEKIILLPPDGIKDGMKFPIAK
jgi:RND family efflux transporter MFP subunit